MREKKKIGIILAGLFLVGFFLRIWRVNNYPPLLWDEAALGYNAYSILKTGRDEHGQFLPLIFKSFGDYKPGLYVYLTLPFVAIFGLNELAVRLPSVILGSLMPLFLYLLVKEVFKKKNWPVGQWLAILSAAVLTFLPWHIHFSRGAWETNAMMFFLVLGSWLFMKSLSSLSTIHYSLFAFLLSLWSYQSAKMLVPLILLGLLIFGKLEIVNWKLSCKAGLSFGRKILPLIILFLMGAWYWQSFSGPAKNRLKVMNLFSHRRPQEEIQQLLNEDNEKEKNLHFYIFHGEWLHFFRGSLTRYFNHFSPRFLAFDGDWSNPRHSAPYFGMIGHVNFVLLIIGLGFFISKKRSLKEYFFLYWLLVAPLPAALTRDIVSGVRALGMVVPISFFIGYGLINIKISKSAFRYLLFTIILLDFIYWFDLYHTHMVKRLPKEWLYGYKEAISFVMGGEDKFDKVILTDFYGQPHIYYLFYSGYSPSEYQQKLKLTENEMGDVAKMEFLDKISFRPASWGSDRDAEDALIVFPRDEFLRGELEGKPEAVSRLEPLGVINNQPMFYGLKNK